MNDCAQFLRRSWLVSLASSFDGGIEAVVHRRDRRVEEVGFRLEVIVDSRLHDLCVLRDVVDTGLGEALLGKDGDSGFDDGAST